jgi:Tol biopolymer transport system component
MAANHGQWGALGRGVYALAACAVVAATGLAAGAATGVVFAGPAGPPPALTRTMLTSVGTGGAAATASNARPAISANGRYVAFQSQATLNVSGSVVPPASPPPTTPPPTTASPTTASPSSFFPPGTAAEPPSTAPPTTPTSIPRAQAAPSAAPAASAPPGNWRVYVRDQTGQVTSLLSNPNTGNATAPSISGTGKLVSYLFDGGIENNVVVVNRQATGKGAFDTKANLAVKTVTGTSNDLRFERIPGCPTGIGAAGAIRTTPCGPELSADGTTLAYPAQLSPVSPVLTVTDFDDNVAGNIVDFGTISPNVFSEQQINYTLSSSSQPVAFTGFTITGPFTIGEPFPESGPDCSGTFEPGVTCNVVVEANSSACPTIDSNPYYTELTGTLTTDSALPDGQSKVTLVAFCNAAFTGDVSGLGGPSAAIRPAIRPAAGCAAPPKGLPVVQAPAVELDNAEDDLVDFGPAVIGQPYAAVVKFSAPGGEILQFSSPDCGLQLVSPASLGKPAGQPLTCTPTETSGVESCTAYILVTPGMVGTDVATFISVDPDDDFNTDSTVYVSVTGVSDVVIARHDKTGAGNFAASPSIEVSVNGAGTLIPDASEPSVSATGRYVAFTASAPAGEAADSTAVWRHDTDSAGNRTYHSGATALVSCLPGTSGGGACLTAPDADSPSISGDGSQVAFATIAVNGQVYIRNVPAATTALVSAPATGTAANADSYAPSLSQDGSTVAYISTATDLERKATLKHAANLYVRTLSPGGPAISELAPTGASLPAGDDIALPDVDADGGLVTFQTSQRLVSAAPPAVTSVYTFLREPALAFQPAPVSFGTLTTGKAPATLTVTITDVGPGPGTVTTAGTTPPFGIKIGACAGAVLHDGGSCVVTVTLIPQPAGTDDGTLAVTVADDFGSPGTFSVPITATVVATPTPEAARLTLDPGVAPPGQVTDVTGSGFLAGQHVTLSWDPGLGQVSVVANASGRLTAVMVIFPDDFTGPRVLQARDLSSKLLATVDFLVQQPSVEPPFKASSAAGSPGAPG